MLFGSKRTSLVEHALKRTAKHFRGRKPEIIKYLFYGPVDSAPQYLAVWFIFRTDSELTLAENEGLCDEIRNIATEQLLKLGYPAEALGVHTAQQENKLDVFNHALLFDMRHQTVQILFTSHENIVRKADGDYNRFFH